MKIPPLVDLGPELNADEMRRYKRHVVIPEISLEGQRRLKNAKVVCIGAGGLGSPILMYLAAAGVGTLGIVEFDTVDESNLQRQVIYGHSDIGKSKANCAKSRVTEINPDIRVNVHELQLDTTNAINILKNYDLIIDGTDNFATRYLINDACVLLNKPYIWGSVLRFDGQASLFWAQYGACYRCVHPVPSIDSPSCAEAGVIGSLCATIASIQATEAIKLITGIGASLIGSLIMYDALNLSYETLKLSKDPSCVLCGENPTQTSLMQDYAGFCLPVIPGEITVVELKEKLDSEEDFFLVDVREPHEFEIVSIPGGHLIPLAGFLDGSALKKMPLDTEIVIYCRSGVRSATALKSLRDAGFSRSSHVIGGVIAWAQQIDPTCTVY